MQSVLATGDLTQLLSHLRLLHILGPTDTPRTVATHLAPAPALLHEALYALYAIMLPIALLCRHLPSASPLTKGLANLRANLRLLPALGAAPQSLAQSVAVLCEDDAEATDAASMVLAQAAACETAALLDVWNTLAPASIATDDVVELPAAVDKLAAGTSQTLARTVSLDANLALTRRTTLTLIYDTTDAAIVATDIDTKERREQAHVTMDSPNAIAATDMDTKEQPAQPHAGTHTSILLMANRGDAIGAKMRLIRAQVAALTYDRDTVRALRVVSDTVNERKQSVQRRLERQSNRLAEYRALGRQFETVVEQYASVKSKLDQLVWSKRQLGL